MVTCVFLPIYFYRILLRPRLNHFSRCCINQHLLRIIPIEAFVKALHHRIKVHIKFPAEDHCILLIDLVIQYNHRFACWHMIIVGKAHLFFSWWKILYQGYSTQNQNQHQNKQSPNHCLFRSFFHNFTTSFLHGTGIPVLLCHPAALAAAP